MFETVLLLADGKVEMIFSINFSALLVLVLNVSLEHYDSVWFLLAIDLVYIFFRVYNTFEVVACLIFYEYFKIISIVY